MDNDNGHICKLKNQGEEAILKIKDADITKWIIMVISMLTILISVGISYGTISQRLTTCEKRIEALPDMIKDITAIKKDIEYIRKGIDVIDSDIKSYKKDIAELEIKTQNIK